LINFDLQVKFYELIFFTFVCGYNLYLWLQYKYPDQAKREVLNAMAQFTDLRPALNTHGEDE